MLIPLDRSRPVRDQIYLFMRKAILKGTMKPGDRLPPTRLLARQIGVARNTVVSAYARLEEEGYAEARGAAGTRVAEEIPQTIAAAGREERRPGKDGPRPAGPAAISRFGRRILERPEIYAPASLRDRSGYRWNFEYNCNVSDRAARRAWYRIVRKVAARHEASVEPYDMTRNPGRLEVVLARYLELTRGVLCRPEQIFVISSFQQAFQMAARILLDPGDAVALEDPHRIGARNTFLANDNRVIPIRSDRAGLIPRELPGPGERARLLFASPSHQWPTGAVLPMARRLRLLEWARRHGAWIVENDHNSEHIHSGTPVVSLQGLDGGERVLYVGTFSRLFSPDPEIAYIVVPPSLVEPFSVAKALESYYPPLFEKEVLRRFIESGEHESFLRRTTRRMRALRECLLAEIARLPARRVAVTRSPGGLQVHARLPGLRAGDLDRLVERAGAAGVGIFPDLPFYMRPPSVPGIILGFAELRPGEIREGVARLGEVLAEMEG